MKKEKLTVRILVAKILNKSDPDIHTWGDCHNLVEDFLKQIKDDIFEHSESQGRYFNTFQVSDIHTVFQKYLNENEHHRHKAVYRK